MNTLIPLALAASSLFAGASLAAAPLHAYHGRARPILVFSGAPDDPRTTEQVARFRKSRAALDDRQMTVFVVGPKGVRTLDGAPAPAALDAGALRAAYGVKDDGFAVVLVGKDGGEKFRGLKAVGASELIDLVDQMPMRRDEMR